MHGSDSIVFSIFLIFSGAALFSTLALFTRQSMLVAYILLGVLLGPWGLKLISNSTVISQVGDIGIVFLLFLLGLHLQPQNLMHMLKKVTWVALISSVVLAAVGFAVAKAFGFSTEESLVVGAAMMFSSTIIGLKLLPTTILHHQHTGEVVISVLLMQDIVAIITLLVLNAATSPTGLTFKEIGLISLSFPTLIFVAFVGERYVLVKLFQRFDQIKEYIFLVAIGWALGMAELANVMGLSAEIGAFIGGVALAEGPISLYIAESLKPLRDFFLVMFFFSIGATFNLDYLHVILLPSIILAALMLLIKPILYKVLLRRMGESNHVSWEVGVRLGQVSEFSLLIAYIAASTTAGAAVISQSASYLIQATTILTFVASSYIVVMKYPTPLAFTDKMRQD